jgi:anion-transporting  ArsA/GET3 family ATPase
MFFDRLLERRRTSGLQRMRLNCFSARVLTMDSDCNAKTVLIKTAPAHRLKNEIEALELSRGQKSIRQMVDVVDHPHSLVLEFLDKALYEASCERRLERHDIKRAIRTVLDALAFLHAHKRVHTGQK